MSFPDTTLGGPGSRFPETTQGVGSGFAGLGGRPTPEAVETLCRRYWKPVYSYVRVAWAKSNEDALDLTQAFFAWLLEESALSRFDSERGSFRTFLKTLLRRFIGHQEQALHALKRGGAGKILSLEGSAPLLEDLLPDPRTPDPERAFQQVWAVELVQLCLDRVRQSCAAPERALPFRIYEAHTLGSSESRPTYRELGARYGITEREVETHLTAIRREIRREIEAELLRLTGNERAAREEWDELFGA